MSAAMHAKLNINTDDVDMTNFPKIDTQPVPRLAPTHGLDLRKVERAVLQVKGRIQRATDRYHKLVNKYQTFPEEVRSSEEIGLKWREECHSEFASSGMYFGVLRVLEQTAGEAEREFAKADVENCFESLRSIMPFVMSIENKLGFWEGAMRPHEEAFKKWKKEAAEKAKKAARRASRKEAKRLAQDDDESMTE